MLAQIVCAVYAPCLIVLFMTLFLLTNTTFEKRVTKLFMWAVLLVTVLMVADTIESWTAALAYPTQLRVWMSAIGYTVRPLCIMLILEIIVRNRRNRMILLEIPVAVNGFISFSALFTDIAFTYDAQNEFVRGPLGWSPFIFSGFYLLMLLVVSFFYFKQKNYQESLIVFAIVVAAVLSVAFEVAFKLDGPINTTIALSICFYYMFFHTQTVKRDHLTYALNRRSFYMDADRFGENISAVVSIDLNYLKQINDTQGHQAGDEALFTITKSVEKHLLRDCRLYRIGGDEFAILCMKHTRHQLEQMIQCIREEMAKTNYSCAIGLAMANGSNDFDALCVEADKAMYLDKVKMKRENMKGFVLEPAREVPAEG